MKPLLTIASSLFSIAVFGQTRFGLKAGLNMATMSPQSINLTMDPSRSNEFIPRLNGGIVIEMAINENWFVNTGPTYSGKGFGDLRHEYDTVRYQLNYLEIPAVVGYKFSEEKENRFFVGAGGYMGYGFAGKESWKGGTPGPYYKLHKKDGWHFKRLDAGIIGMVQFEWDGKWGARTSYSHGLLHIHNFNDSDFKPMNRVIEVSLFWLLK